MTVPDRKAKGFPHIERQSREADAPPDDAACTFQRSDDNHVFQLSHPPKRKIDQ